MKRISCKLHLYSNFGVHVVILRYDARV